MTPPSDRECDWIRRFVDRVATQFAVASALEGPVDGAGARRGGHTLLLARRGIPVTIAVEHERDAASVRSAYAAAGETSRPSPCAVVAAGAVAGLPPVDLVVSFDAPPLVPRWEEYFASISTLARKVWVVVVRNPERIGSWGLAHPGRSTSGLAPVLWGGGRVREHAYSGSSQDETVQAPTSTLVRCTARLHAFVVDKTPRSPQARRKFLATV